MSAPTAPPSTARPFQDDDWDLLIEDIERHNVVPVVGAGLLIHGADRSQTLEPTLAPQLRAALGVAGDRLPPNAGILEICSQANRRDAGDRLIQLLKGWPAPAPLRLLAEIDAFDLYVAATFDSLLFDAVRTERANAQRIAFGLRRPTADLVSDRGFPPTVFHLFGALDGTHDCALTEEDVLRFAQRLHDPRHRPANIFDLLARRNLLFLGCDFPGWFGRLSRQLLKIAAPDLRDGGLFVDSVTLLDRAYVLFLERQDVKLWPNGTSVDFVEQLHRRWRERHPVGQKAQVFLSYAREDADVARDLTARLQAEGVTVWFDKDNLRSGEIWSQSIVDAIQGCRVFLPVVSRHSARLEPRRYVHREWDMATGMPDKRITPLLTDPSPLPPAFASAHARPLSEIDSLVRDIRDFLKTP